MKATLFDVKGTKKSQIDLPALFETPAREDIIHKYFESSKLGEAQPYSSYEEAGKRHVASGRLRRRRKVWRSSYGKGASRVPRKQMWRRGSQFYWVGAEVSSARGGRMPHPPKGLSMFRKINKKEKTLAMHAALSATLNNELIAKRYATLDVKSIQPSVIESLPLKTKELISSLSNIFGSASTHVLKVKEVRSGKGKMRSRKYKSSAGLLIIKGEKESGSFSGVDIKSVKEVQITDLYPLGRLTLFTKQAIEEFANPKSKVKEAKK